MKQGYIKAAAATPKVTVADCAQNAKAILGEIKKMREAGAKIMVLPELCVTGYTCEDLFWQESLIEDASEALAQLAESTADIDAVIFLGLPIEHRGKLYNAAAVLNRGKVVGFVPKKNIPNYNEFYEARHFSAGSEAQDTIVWRGEEVPFSVNLLFVCEEVPHLVLAAEICEDLWVPKPPSTEHALAGASVIANLSASDEMTGKDDYRRELVNGQSARLFSGYIYCGAGDGESTSDLVFGGHNMISENGKLLAESERFVNGMITADLDVDRIAAERRRMTIYPAAMSEKYKEIPVHLVVEKTALTRYFDPYPFVPSDAESRRKRCEEILNIQAMGLKSRLEKINCAHAVVGISGGLDSTLALLVISRAFDILGLDRKNITAVTMPCFGTTDRTYSNACLLAETLGATLREIDIKEAVTVHFRDIGQDMNNTDVAYENAQARERTQVLMDIANMTGGLVVGTGDLSELALGWATYNGDHMSMYGVNASVPKTLVRHLVKYYADTCGDGELEKVLLDILETPVSPELLPPKDGDIAQKTEELVGPYELHDFFLYYMLRLGFPPEKIFRVAAIAFAGIYDDAVILKWLKVFIRRFFTQQFKRNCLPDGPKVGSVAVSPRGDLRMPSDACGEEWLKRLDAVEIEA